jgi:hypothetical protein
VFRSQQHADADDCEQLIASTVVKGWITDGRSYCRTPAGGEALIPVKQ